MASVHALHATLSSLRHPRGRVLDLWSLTVVGVMLTLAGVGGCLPPSTCQWGPLLTQEFLEVGLQCWGIIHVYVFFIWDGLSLLLWCWPISHLMWCHFCLPHLWEQLIGHICIGVMFLVLLQGGHSLLGKCLHLVGLGPSLRGAPSAWNYPGHLLVLEEFDVHLSSLAGICLGTFWSGMRSPGNLPLSIVRTWTSYGWRITGSLWSINGWWSSSSSPSAPAESHLPQGLVGGHPSWGPSFPHTFHGLWQQTPHMYSVSPQQSCMRIRLRGIRWQLYLFPHWLCGWPPKPEVLLYWIQDLLMEALLCCLFSLASSR